MEFFMKSRFFILLVAATVFGANPTFAMELNDLEKGRNTTAKAWSLEEFSKAPINVLKKGLKYYLYGAAIVSASSCPRPEGSYLNSCHNVVVMPYKSTDPNVPVDACRLITQCNSIIPSIPPTTNTIYFQSTSGVRFGNNNGTLTVLDELGRESPISAKESVVCSALPGSHDLSCEVEVLPYQSTDENLEKTPFCQMKSHCRNLDDRQTTLNTVYFAHEHQRGKDVAVENCDGRLVIHSTRSADGMCAKKTPDKIKHIAQEKGQTTQVIKEEL
jgi:hypothetical protein